jgi:hypothetical protein
VEIGPAGGTAYSIDGVSQTSVMTRTGKSDVTIDFGNGACDKLATATVNGKVFNITLR